MSTSANIIPIPQELLEHPAIEHHPGVKKLHEVHGGIPPDADEGVVEGVLQFANAIANHAVEPGTKSRRTDPSPRRTARVWRSQVLGHRDPSESPERAAQLGASSNDASPGPSHSPVRARYRSRSRQPTTTTVKEEEDDGVKSVRFPGKRDEQNANDGTITALEHRVSVMIQQQHEFHERLLQRFTVVEKRVEGAEARNKNKVNQYLGRALIPVPNGKDPIPPNLTALTSLDVIRTLPMDEVNKWLQYYTGQTSHGEDRGARQALRACTGVDVQLV